MLVIGERINATNKMVGAAISRRDAAFIQQLATRQVADGAAILDVNAGVEHNDEPERMEWLVRTVQAAIDISLCIDSTDAEAIHRGLAAHRGRALVNSVSGEAGRAESVLPLVKKHAAAVVCLAVAGGVPTSAAERSNVASALVAKAKEHGIPPEDIYIDPAVLPASLSGRSVGDVLTTISGVKAALGVQTIVGLSNVSFGLPNRRLLNRTFLAMALAAGLDAAILDPTDPQLMSTLKSAEALLGRDEYCLAYIKAHREGKLA